MASRVAFEIENKDNCWHAHFIFKDVDYYYIIHVTFTGRHFSRDTLLCNSTLVGASLFC